ncbi:hypothetical protein LEP1GSC038_1118 [Leptospira weilii str. 2006001855]|uniref:DUF167 domain-containing protein n=1 Tax=Leptospira weilii str. 2006001855 TaxID=996804 RepID=M6FH93_9LEPT|nr:hypothetical protein LEP1GSC038_1118 [Leptospira weilii str. 2006001855]
MKFTVRVKPNSKKIFFRKEEDGSITIAVRELALDGKANGSGDRNDFASALLSKK